MNEKEEIRNEISYLETIKPEVNELHDFVTNFATGYYVKITETPEYLLKMLGVVMKLKQTIIDYQFRLQNEIE